jgi:hypothetical protein
MFVLIVLCLILLTRSELSFESLQFTHYSVCSSLCNSLIILYVVVYVMFDGGSLTCVFSPQKMINGGTIDHWACLSFSRMRPEEVYRFCVDLIQMCNATGMVKCELLSCSLGTIYSIQDMSDFCFQPCSLSAQGQLSTSGQLLPTTLRTH